MTLGESAYQNMRADILRGCLAPGQKLGLEVLKARYGLSFSPLREALNRLQAERLVVATAGRGFAVAPVSSAELWDTTEVRILVDSEALRRSIAAGDDAWEDALVASFHALDLQNRRLRARGDAVSDADLSELEARHRDFHAALIGACGSARLLLLFDQFYAETQRYRLPALGGPALTGRDLAGEHHTLMQAALDRKPDEAAALLATHYRRTASQIDPAQSAQPALAVR